MPPSMDDEADSIPGNVTAQIDDSRIVLQFLKVMPHPRLDFVFECLTYSRAKTDI